MNVNILRQAGIDYEHGVQRLLDDCDLYEALLASFLDDAAFAETAAAFAAKDYPQLFNASHSIKGACGNLDMTALYEASCALTELLRDNPAPDEARVCALFTDMRAAYERACDGICAAALAAD